MATPSYKGPGQPAVANGWLGAWLGGTPAYQGAGQPTTRTSMFGGESPAYRPVPSGADAMSAADPSVCNTPIAIVIPREVIEQP